MQNKGLHTHRFEQNPLERIFAEEWEKENRDERTLKYLLKPPSNIYPVYVEDNDREIIATVIQWLGSPVGQAFLGNVQEAIDAERKE